MNCPRCGAALRPDGGYCPQCGAKYAAQRVRRAEMKSPLTGLFIALIAVLSVLVVGAAGFLVWYFFT